MELELDGARPSSQLVAAMQRGLDALGQAETRVVWSSDLERTINRLEARSIRYVSDRGTGVVAARNLWTPEGDIVVVNGAEVGDRPPADLERLLAHEAGHSVLRARREDFAHAEFTDRFAPPLAAFYSSSAVAIEEFRIERRLAELGYPQAEQTTVEALEDQLFHLADAILIALFQPESEDPAKFAASVLNAQNNFTTTLAYLAGAVASWTTEFDVGVMSRQGRELWADLAGQSWPRRVELWNSVPPLNTDYPEPHREADLRRSVVVHRQHLAQMGFTVTGGSGPGDSWGFYRRSEADHMFNRWVQMLQPDQLQ